MKSDNFLNRPRVAFQSPLRNAPVDCAMRNGLSEALRSRATNSASYSWGRRRGWKKKLVHATFLLAPMIEVIRQEGLRREIGEPTRPPNEPI
jgi:hypothetical protein